MTLRIGIIGAGKIVRVRHLPETASHPNAEVVAVCDIVKERADELAREYDCKAYTAFQKLIEDPEVRLFPGQRWSASYQHFPGAR